MNTDFLCFQEFPNDNDLINRIKTWGDFTDYSYKVCCKSHVTENIDVGVVIFSKYKINESCYFNLPIIENIELIYQGKKEIFHKKFFVCIKTQINKNAVNIISGHGYPFYRYNIPESISSGVFDSVDNWIKSFLENDINSTIMAGDMNVVDPLEYMGFCKKNMYDVFYGISTRPSGRKTDAIIVPNCGKVVNMTNIKSNFDHNIIQADIIL